MAMTEEEKREKLLKLKYDRQKTDATALYGAFVTFYVSTIILCFNEYAREGSLYLVPFSCALVSFFIYTRHRGKMHKYQKKLEKMYAPEE